LIAESTVRDNLNNLPKHSVVFSDTCTFMNNYYAGFIKINA